ncbi:hypothetical protein L1987_09777 [Smallanthus sonchifolius]|uniref:Uncharacterized protein n=1 Tax=Smallanthus sonchifolius TaxID=185202 RepID=A0ACB9JQA0_9ASTR|nr:hypothetical protein L1987_09777 [Smallanthus sonchifolius]
MWYARDRQYIPLETVEDVDKISQCVYYELHLDNHPTVYALRHSAHTSMVSRGMYYRSMVYALRHSAHASMVLRGMYYRSREYHMEKFNSNFEIKSIIQYVKRIAVVTGGKRGIGFEICKQLVSSDRDLLVVITAKDEQKGLQSLDKLRTLGLSENVAVRQLNVKNPASIASFADFINTKFGKLDILVNNAGVNGIIVDEKNLNVKPDEVTGVKQYMTKQIMLQTYETAKDCIETNYYGTKHVTEALLPFLNMSTSPRIVNISTGISKLENIKDDRMKKMLSNVDGLTEDVLEEVVTGFLRDAKDNLLEEKGWDEPFSAYIVSKTVINAYTRVLAKKYPSFRINTVNPGFTKTEMTHYQGIYTPDEAAKGPVRLALIPDEGPSGRFFFQTEETNF